MQISTVFQLSVFGLACLANVMLGVAEGSAVPYAMSLPLALAAFFLTERGKVFRLPTLWANLFGILAFVLAGSELFGGNIEARVLSGAHLLVYVSWIVFFLEKTSKQYWWMCALGVMQVAVGSVLTTEGWFGVLLVCYMFLGIWTLSVFSLAQAQAQFATKQQASRLGVLSVATPKIHPPPVRQADGVVSTGSGFSVRRISFTRGAIQLDPNQHWISPRFVLGSVITACLGMVLSTCLFLLIPRLWIGNRSILPAGSTSATQRLTGFTEEVQLGDMGQILESTERALNVRLFDNDTGEKIGVEEYAARLGYDEPMFRGAVLREYQNGSWSAGTLEQTYRRTVSEPPEKGLIRQEIRMEPIGTDILFAVHPVVACKLVDSLSRARQHGETAVLIRLDGAESKEPCSYTVYSLPVPAETVAGRSYAGRPYAGRPGIARVAEYMLQRGRSRYLALPQTGLENLKQQAKQIAEQDSENGRPSDAQVAERLESYLRDSDEFSYSLNASVQDASIDPVEDFLFNRKTGHCEYYASAMALMLRAVDIPSRLVSGFKGGTTNNFFRQFEVQQRHAHTWVEAYIDSRWYVFDPTNSQARTASVASMSPKVRSWSDFKELLNESWYRYAVNINISQQRQAFYSPMQMSAKDWWDVLKGGGSKIDNTGTSIREFLVSPKRWFSLQGGVATFALLLFGALAVWLFRKTVNSWSSIRGLLGPRARSQVEFYERFRKLCQARGLLREVSQTQREFADVVHRSLNELLTSCGLVELPRHVVDSFYQVRFGDEALDQRQAAAIDQRLSLLEQSLESSADRQKRNRSGR